MGIIKKKSAAMRMITGWVFFFFLAFGALEVKGGTLPPAGSLAATSPVETEEVYGGGYAITGQIPRVSYTSELYDASNGLPTSDAMCILGSREGCIWMGGYSGVIRYDGTSFERLDSKNGLTSARYLLEDSRGRIWAGTNDNGVVVLDGDESMHLTYREGLPASSVRAFAEDPEGNMIIGTTAGLCYATPDLSLHPVPGADFSEERIMRLDADPAGRIYGVTAGGILFSIDDCAVTETYRGEDLGIRGISMVASDPTHPGRVYLGTGGRVVYYGNFGDNAKLLKKISVSPLSGIHWINVDCGRVFVSSISAAGFLDEEQEFHLLEHLPVNTGIEMITSDYQGNLWMASSTQGVLKIIANQFTDLTGEMDLPEQVVNSTCYSRGKLYAGTDEGLRIFGEDGELTENKLTEAIGEARIRCIREDESGNLWFACYTKDVGLLCYSKEGRLSSFTTEEGMPDNQVRCVSFLKDGRTVAGTNSGVAVIRKGRVERVYGQEDGIINTVILTVEEGENGEILAGSDGDGIYVIGESGVRRLGRNDGLTSDVILRITRDEKRGGYWIVTSNSLEFWSEGKIREISSFPYNNNYEIHFDEKGNAWILSSYGVYVVDGEDLLEDSITLYSLYTAQSGLPYAITSNSFSGRDAEGNLYISGRKGVIRVNIDHYYAESETLLSEVNSIYCDEERILPDEEGVFHIPASRGRVQITASVMDYTMLDPTVHLFLAEGPDDGITARRSNLTPLEYTNLPYGDYTLHIQVIDHGTGELLQDQTFPITKAASLSDLLIVRIMLLIGVILLAGFVVWRVMRSTVIRRQYNEIRVARDEAERANTAKSRFLANMSHEIRTPINTIMGMNEMTMREDATGVPKEYFASVMGYASDIRNASESLLGLINDLLDISKIESGKMHLVEMEYDVADMLRSVVSMIRIRSTEKELTFEVEVEEELPRRLFGDAGKIKQIILNLLTNAVKYTEEGGLVLKVSSDGTEGDLAKIRFSVKDTGMGVKEEDMERLFTAYERLDEEKNSAIQGTGLGLDISRRFAELMGGRLWCESVYGEGSEFLLTVTQRIVDEEPLGVFVEQEAIAKGPYVPKFIAPDADVLVVDDTPMNLNVIKGLLKATRVFVTTSNSGEDALDKIRDSHFDVVLLDHMMPGMDGIETVARIREFAPDLPVYALTANATAGEEFYKSKGFNGYLAKPVDSELLEKTIMKHLSPEMMEIPSPEDFSPEEDGLPEDKMWLYETEGISVDDGIRNSGGAEGFLLSLNLFLDGIESNSKVLEEALTEKDLKLFTIKVHALKSSARIIGAKELSTLAEELENAGNRQDETFITEHVDQLLTDYGAYKERLSRLRGEESGEEEKAEISAEELSEAYAALSDVIPQMDYDAVEMILEGLREYRLPEEDERKREKLTELLKSFDWDGMEELIREGN